MYSTFSLILIQIYPKLRFLLPKTNSKPNPNPSRNLNPQKSKLKMRGWIFVLLFFNRSAFYSFFGYKSQQILGLNQLF